MKTFILFISLAAAIYVTFGCAVKSKHHEQDLPDPQGYNAHFPDMDLDGDDLVDWTEFKQYFSQARQDVFNAVDLNTDGYIDYDEWHEFKEAHGLMHKE